METDSARRTTGNAMLRGEAMENSRVALPPRHLGRAATRLDQSSLAYTCSARGAIAAPPSRLATSRRHRRTGSGGRVESMQGIRERSTDHVDNQTDNSVVAPHEHMVSLWTVRLTVGRIDSFFNLLLLHFVNKSVAAILISRRPCLHRAGRTATSI